MKNLVPVFIFALVAVLPFQASARDPFATPGFTIVDPVGSYSGVMIPDQSANATEVGEDVTLSAFQRAESLGLFSMGVPQSGLASGSVVIFSRGRVFAGALSGHAERDGGEFFAVIRTFFGRASGVDGETGQAGSLAVEAIGSGAMVGRISPPTSDTRNFSFTTRLTGSAVIEISLGQVDGGDGSSVVVETIPFIVSGFRQTNAFTGGGNTIL